jgi:riboflavin biosynthesis pyrimidine reductase
VVLTCFDPQLVAERMEKLGKANPYPMNIIVSLDGTDVPLDHSIFSLTEIQTIIATSKKGGDYLKAQYGQNALLIGPYFNISEVDLPSLLGQIQDGLRTGQRIVLMTGQDAPDARVFLYVLRKMGIKHLLIESPTYMWLLMNQQLLDEFFVDYSSLFIGGSLTPGYSNGFSYLHHPHSKFLVIAMHKNSFIFTRQKLIYGLTAEK